MGIRHDKKIDETFLLEVSFEMGCIVIPPKQVPPITPQNSEKMPKLISLLTFKTISTQGSTDWSDFITCLRHHKFVEFNV